MDATEHFVDLVSRADVPLDRAALAIVAHVRSELDVDGVLAELDALAARCTERTFPGLAAHLFAREGFRGDRAHYGDPENSFLDAVLARRLGIPITLSLVMVEVGRRIGVAVVPIGLPGHFVVRSGDDPDAYCDPFAGGRLLDIDGCAAVFRRVHGRGARFHPSLLTPVGPQLILARVLANLERTDLARDPIHLDWMLRCHLAVPGVPARHRVALASRLGRIGRYGEAAALLDALARELPDAAATPLRSEATALRSRYN